ncbi:MAG: (Fe-S)-binding protein [Promethearchaeia archaeon]
MTKIIFLGCLSRSRYKQTCENAIKLIKSIDNEYKVFDDAPCCGALSFHIANDNELKKHVDFVVNWFENNNITDLVTICAGCYNYFTKYYPKFNKSFNIKIQHILQFLAEPENLEKLNLKYTGKKLTIAYHDPCHLRTAKPKILKEPREIIRKIQGNIILKEINHNLQVVLCCGAGGGVYSSFKENSDYNSFFILEQTKKQRAKILLSSCPFCYTALRRIKEENKSIKIDIIKFEDFIYKISEGVDPLNE